MLNLASTDYDTQRKALWYLLSIPIYLMEKVKHQILMTRDPVVIKRLIFEQAPALVYDPNDFIDELFQFIKRTFVRKEGGMTGILSKDPGQRLDAMRNELQREINREFRDFPFETANFATFLY